MAANKGAFAILRENPDLARRIRPLLPDSVREMADLIGLDKAMLVVAQLGGRTIDVPKGAGPPGRDAVRRLAELIGLDAALELTRQYGGSRGLYIPTCDAAKGLVLDWRIKMRYEQLSQSLSTRRAVAELCTEFGTSDRHIWRALDRARKADQTAARTMTQLSLFGAAG